MFGRDLAILPDTDSMLDSEGKYTRAILTMKPTHNMGDIVESRSGARYMVREDGSLRKL